MPGLFRTPARRIDPKASDAPQIVRDAEKKGFRVTYHRDRFGYLFRHRLGKCIFFVAELSQVSHEDIDVWN